MAAAMNKSELVTKMRAIRTEWEALLAQITPVQMTQPNMVEDWSIKDVIFHCTSYARSYVRALEAVLHHDPLPDEVTDRTPIDERNQLHFQESQLHSLTDVLTDARTILEQLIELTEAHSEAFLIEPQQFEGVPEPVVVWQGLDHVCNHYRGHMQSIRAGFQSTNKNTG
jgi:hypothetical protein